MPDDSTPLLPTKTENDDPLEEDDGFYHPDVCTHAANLIIKCSSQCLKAIDRGYSFWSQSLRF